MNRKIFVTAVILTATTFWLSAQDIIITKDSRRIRAIVTEVNVNDVKYKAFTKLWSHAIGRGTYNAFLMERV